MSSGDTQSMVFYIVLLVFLLSSFIAGRRVNLKQSVKYFLAWIGIALFIVLLYSFRFEFEFLKNRLLGELSPSVARNVNGKVIINLSKDGHFYVNTKINGQFVRFLVDTGASDVVLNLKDARRVGIDINKLRFNKIYHTANGTVRGAGVVLKRLEFADMVFENVRASVNSSDLDISLLGMSFLQNFGRYEVYQDKLILHYQ